MRGERPLVSGLLLGELGRRWAEVVGDRLARETRPASLDRGMLTVRASSSAWAAQVRFLGDEIRGRANEALKREAVGGVRVTVDGGPVDR
jgi:predicted nucleic acid-binding Zn ribbon protein